MLKLCLDKIILLLSRFGSQRLPANTTSFLPFFGTDFGLCSVIKPQVYCAHSEFTENNLFNFCKKVTFSEDQAIRDLPWDQKLFAGIFRFTCCNILKTINLRT